MSEKIIEARSRYRPDVVERLLIAEAPPDSLDRFFYYEDVRSADYLFLGVTQVLYPTLRESYINLGRPKHQKEKMLRQFQREGFFLMDILDIPVGCHAGILSEGVPGLLDRMSRAVDKETPIILIKTTVYDAAAHALVDAGYRRVVHERIPFPGQGWQKKFRPPFSRALIATGWKLK